MTTKPPERTTEMPRRTPSLESPVVQSSPSPPGCSPQASGDGEGTGLSGKAWRDAVKAATSALHKQQRTRRAGPREKPIVGVRAAQGPRGEQR